MGLVTTVRVHDSLWVSLGLFVGTSAAFAWSRRNDASCHRPNEEDEDWSNGPVCDWSDWYRRRRRLSFHDITELDVSDEDDDRSSRNLPTLATEDLLGNSDNSRTSLEAADFFPKNRNWAHFETHDAKHDLDTYRSIKKVSLRPNDSQSLVQASLEGDCFPCTEELSAESNGGHAVPFPSRDPSHSAQSGRTITQSVEAGDFRALRPANKLRSSLRRSQSLDVDEAVLGQLFDRQANAPADMASVGSLWYDRSMALEDDVLQQNRFARTNYNAQIMPDKVILVRHGQSMGNIDETLYSTTADNAMPLTKLGWDQAREAGKMLRQSLLQDSNSVHFIVSPYVRTVETFHGIVSAWCDPSEYDSISDPDEKLQAWYERLLEMGVTWHEDPRIREQDFGNFQDPAKIKQAKADRQKFGAFYYRFPHGESASDVFDRMSTFLDSLWRSFDVNKSRNYVIITHGISIRVLLARYFRYTIDQFHLLSNPRNCEIVRLEHDGAGKLQMKGRHELRCKTDPSTQETEVTGYKYSTTLRVLPSKYVNKVKARIQFEELS